MAEPKIRYDIEAAIKGGQDAQTLAKTLRELGDVLEGDLQQGAQGAAQALEALGAKQRALDAFKALSTETRKLSGDLEKASADVDRLGNELEPVSVAAKAFAQAEKEAKAAVDATQSSLARQRQALREARNEADVSTKKTQEYKQTIDGLKASIAASRQSLADKKRALDAAGDAARKVAQAERGLQKEYDVALGSSQRLSRELGVKNAALSETRSHMASLGVATTNLVQHERNLKNAVQQVRQEVERMAPAYQQAANQASAATLKQAAATRTLRDGVGELGAQLQRIQSIAMVALGGTWAAGKAKEIADVADEFKNLQARVKLATGEGELFAGAWGSVTRIALETNAALDGTATLFARVAEAGKSAGLSVEAAARQSLALTETINQATQLSGASADSANAAITQLIQGLQSGVLRGEEFNSVMEQAPRLAKALADGLGVTTGELRKLAGEGALTTDVVIKALQGQADVVAKEFEKLPATVGRALQNLSTQWTLYVGSADAGLLSSENAAKAIDYLAQNLDTLVNTLQTAGKLWAAMKIAQLAGDFGAWATKTLTATAAMEANTVATAANTAVQKANAVAVGASAAALGAQAAAAKTSAFVQGELAKNAKNVAIFAGQSAKAQQSANAVLVAGAGAAGRAAGGMGLLGGAVRGVTAFLGGPVGLIATVLLFNQEIKSGIQGVVEWGMGFTEAGRKLKAFEEEQRKSEAAARAQKEAADQAAAAAKRMAAAQDGARNASFGLTKQGEALIATFAGLVKDGQTVDEALGKIGKNFDLSSQPGIQNASAVLDKLLADGRITADQFAGAWQNALQSVDLGVFEVNARAALQGSVREAEQLAQVMDAVVRQAVDRTGLDFDVLRGRIGAASRSAINDVDAIAASMDRLKAQGVDAGFALQTSLAKAINTADSQQAVQALMGKVADLRKELGNTVADGLLEQAAEKARALQNALEDATPGIQSVQEAMRQLGVVTDASLKETAETARKAYEVVRDSGTATPREIALAFEKAADAAEKSADRAIKSWAKAEKERLRYQNPPKEPDKKPDPGQKPKPKAPLDAGGLELTKEEQERIQGLRDSGDHLVAANELRKIKWRQEKEAGDKEREARGAENASRSQEALDKVAGLNTAGSDRDLLQEYLGDNKKNPLQAVFPKGAITFQMPAAPLRQGVGRAAVPPTQVHRHEFSFDGQSAVVNTDESGSAGLQQLLEHLERARGASGF